MMDRIDDFSATLSKVFSDGSVSPEEIFLLTCSFIMNKGVTPLVLIEILCGIVGFDFKLEDDHPSMDG
jgi:hypothetical protein